MFSFDFHIKIFSDIFYVYIFCTKYTFLDLTNIPNFPLDQPKLDKDPTIAKAASDKGRDATLTCRATGAPNITFLWSRHGSVLSTKDEEKYVTKTNMKTRYMLIMIILY